MMNIINNGQINRLRKGTIPSSIKNNKDFTFGMRSDIDSNSDISPGKYAATKGGSGMKGIFTHTDNLKDSLVKKIEARERILE